MIDSRVRIWCLEGFETARAWLASATNLPETEAMVLILEPNSKVPSENLLPASLQKLEGKKIFKFQGSDMESFAAFLLFAVSTGGRTSWPRSLRIVKEDSNAQTPERRSLFERYRHQLDNFANYAPRLSGFRSDGLLGIEFLLENRDFMERAGAVADLKNAFQGLPALILSTGPSLAKSLDSIRALESKAVLIAPDASLKVLLQAGIAPHFVCSLERELASKPFFESLKLNSTRSPHLVAYPVVPREVLQAFTGPQWCAFRSYRSHFYFEKQLNKGFLRSGHSVAHMCVELADWMGCSEIILVGQDLCFDSETLSTHSEGVAYAGWSQAQSREDLIKKLEAEGDTYLEHPGNLEARVPTRAAYVVFAREFGVMTRWLKAKLTNATKGGLRIPDVNYEDLGRIVSRLKDSNLQVFDESNRLHRQSLSKQTASLDLDPLIQALQQKIKQVRSQRELLKASSNISVEQMGAATLSHIQSQLRAQWMDLQKDHVVEAFAFELAGGRLNDLEGEWFERELDEAGSKTEILNKRTGILLDVFEEILESMTSSLALLEASCRTNALRQKKS